MPQNELVRCSEGLGAQPLAGRFSEEPSFGRGKKKKKKKKRERAKAEESDTLPGGIHLREKHGHPCSGIADSYCGGISVLNARIVRNKHLNGYMKSPRSLPHFRAHLTQPHFLQH